MNVNEVIKYPILTEKTYKQMDDNVYTFAVDKRTNKVEVRKAVEFIFDVEVARVNIMLISKKPKKLGRFAGFVSGYKKAIVKLEKGTINYFPNENQGNDEPSSKKKTKKTTEMSEIEKKAAAKIKAKANMKLTKEKATPKSAQTANKKSETKPIKTTTKKVASTGKKTK